MEFKYSLSIVNNALHFLFLHQILGFSTKKFG